MDNCMENAKVLKEGIKKTGRFEIISEDVGVPLVAIALKDSNTYTVFEISESLRKFGWIIPACTMPPNAQHLAVLRIVIREDLNRNRAERLVLLIQKVLKELDELHSRIAAHVTPAKDEKEHQKEEEVVRYWRRLVYHDGTSRVC
ncbi:glutamate decarboxylase 5-like [Malania oleifera]|uniref:glutamate decarboxylase 5-like n=1 Tax=Malania oleifera TaxID=397392 RepID=UPI0025AE25CF|nr:glutamate decarboxylase 5-like [Malania oleifera]